MYTTTLKTLRQNKACIEGYNKLVRFLQNREFTTEDENRKYYLRYNYTEVIPVANIVESNGITDALWVINRAVVGGSNRIKDLILFAVWCARQVEHLMTDQRSRNTLDVAEAFANGEATEAELINARAAAYAAAYAARAAAYAADAADAYAAYAAARAAAYAARAAAYAVADVADAYAAYAAARAVAYDARDTAAYATAASAQKEMLIKVCNDTAPWQVI